MSRNSKGEKITHAGCPGCGRQSCRCPEIAKAQKEHAERMRRDHGHR